MKEMKRFGKIAIWSLCFAILTLSCTKVEQAESAQAQISYNVVQYTQTKAAGEYPTNVPFVSSTFYLENGKTWAANRSDAKPYIENAIISYDASRTSWHDADHSYYWPRAGKLTFFSYSPKAIKDYTQIEIDRNNGITIPDWDVDSHQNVDIMIADVQTDQTANQTGGTYKGVPTIFRHKLSQIVGFEFNTFEDYAHGHDGTSKPYQNKDFVFIVKEISIGNLIQKGSYYSSFDVGTAAAKIGAWIPDGSADASSYTWYQGAGKEIIYSTTSMTSIDGKALMILPQTFENPGEADPRNVPHLKLVYTQRSYNASSYSDTKKTTYVSLYDLFQSSANKINLNRQIKVRITFNRQANLITWAPDQDDWSDSEFSVII